MLDTNQLDSFAAVFSTLAALHLRPPQQEVLDTVRSMSAEWPLSDDEDTVLGISALQRSSDRGEDADQVTRDHDRIYGDSAAAVVPPFESVHRSKEGLVFDAETLQVRQAYRDLGLRAPRLNREPDDHIGLELEFLSRTCLAALDALGTADLPAAERAQRAGAGFLKDHLLAWAPDFLDRVREAADTEFMTGLALLTRGALAEYADALGTEQLTPGVPPDPAAAR